MDRQPTREKDRDCFASVSIAHRKFEELVYQTLCTLQLVVHHASVFKQTDQSDCFPKHVGNDRNLHCFIMVLAIYDLTRAQWFTPKDHEVSGGADVFDNYSGDRDDNPNVHPVRYPLNHVGDCTIFRGAHFANMTVKPPPAFDVYKYVIFFALGDAGGGAQRPRGCCWTSWTPALGCWDPMAAKL